MKRTNRIDRKFEELRRKKKKAFIPFLTAGYPDLSATAKLVLEFEKNGADIIELGVPFSDPIADGPVIQASSYEAIKKGVTLFKILRLIKSLRTKTDIPIAAMTYYNPILKYGPEKFVKDASKCGLDAVIIPDLPPEEELSFTRSAEKAGIHVILFIAPTTSQKRVRFIAKRAKGFIYFVSLTGVTGMRRSLPKELKNQIASVKRVASGVPVCAGFGISSASQARLVSSMCDGVIVGSAIIDKISKNLSRPNLAKIAGTFIKNLSGVL